MHTMKLFKSTIGVGLILDTVDGHPVLIQFKTAREIKCRTFDEVYWIQEPTPELIEAATYATAHKKKGMTCNGTCNSNESP